MDTKQLKSKLNEIASLAKEASFKLGLLDEDTKNAVLRQLAKALQKEKKSFVQVKSKPYPRKNLEHMLILLLQNSQKVNMLYVKYS